VTRPAYVISAAHAQTYSYMQSMQLCLTAWGCIQRCPPALMLDLTQLAFAGCGACRSEWASSWPCSWPCPRIEPAAGARRGAGGGSASCDPRGGIRRGPPWGPTHRWHRPAPPAQQRGHLPHPVCALGHASSHQGRPQCRRPAQQQGGWCRCCHGRGWLPGGTWRGC
jgi:hypothetical protein